MGYGVATNNPFDLLGDENEAPEVAAARASAAAQEKVAAAAALEKKAAEAKADKPGKISSGGRGGNQARGRGDGRGGRGNDRGGRGYDRSAREDAGEEVQDSGSFRGAGRGGRGGRGGDRSGRGGRGYGGDGEDSRPRRRDFDRRSGTGRGVGDMKRGGAGKGNWGSNNEAPGSEAKPDDKVDGEVVVEKEDGVEQVEESATVPIVAEEDNEMTLEEYQKAAEEKKAAFKAQFGSGGKAKKAALDKELEKLAVVEKKPENPVFFVGATEDGVSKSKTKEKKEVCSHWSRDIFTVVAIFAMNWRYDLENSYERPSEFSLSTVSGVASRTCRFIC